MKNLIRAYKLPSNHVAASAPIPPLELLEPLIDRKSGRAGGHWLWDGSFASNNAPVFSWRVGKKSYRYYVARVLYQHLVQKPHRYTGFINRCGAFACINPAHWHSRTKEEDREAYQPVVIVDDENPLYK